MQSLLSARFHNKHPPPPTRFGLMDDQNSTPHSPLLYPRRWITLFVCFFFFRIWSNRNWGGGGNVFSRRGFCLSALWAQTSQTANTRVIMTVRIIRHGQSLFLSPTHNAVRCVTLHCRERDRERESRVVCCPLPASLYAPNYLVGKPPPFRAISQTFVSLKLKENLLRWDTTAGTLHVREPFLLCHW